MELDLELDVVDREPTVLEYARFYGLCSDYTQDFGDLDGIVALADEEIIAHLRDPEGAPTLANSADGLTRERLSISRDAALLLKWVHLLPHTAAGGDAVEDGRARVSRMKLEVPILGSDVELDMLAFGSGVQSGFAGLKIPLEPVDEGEDGGLEGPSRYDGYPTMCLDRANRGKLVVSREGLLYLQDAVKVPDLSEVEEVVEESLGGRKNHAVRTITPPLLPLSPPSSPYIPSSPGNHLELISNGSNSTAEEAGDLEQQIMSADALVRHDSDSSEIMLMDMDEPCEFEPTTYDVDSPAPKRKASCLKVEGPLTPSMFSESPAKKLKTVVFAEMLVEYIPAHPFNDNDPGDPDLPSNFENGNDILSPEDDYAFFKDVAEPYAEEANWKVESEKLSEADTMKRVDVPYVDFRPPTAPWDEFSRGRTQNHACETELDAQARFLLWIKRNHMKAITSWHGISELERTLPLAPFSHESAKVTIEEKLHGGDVVNKMLAEIAAGEIATSSTNMWKRDGLRVLDEEQDEEPLEPVELEERRDMNSLPRKCKLELEEKVADQECANIEAASTSVKKLPNPQRGVHESHHWRNGLPVTRTNSTLEIAEYRERQHAGQSKAAKSQDRDKSLMFGGRFSATSALDNFMALHGITAKPKAAGKDDDAPKRPAAPPLRSPIHQTQCEHDDATAHPDSHMEMTQPPPKLPPLPEQLPPCSFVISSTLLQRRSLSKQIENLYPDAEFVSRDFDSHHAVNQEADLILSPSTGLIIVTLQLLKQRALPGQPDRSPVKERMLALQHTYERLVVVVTEGLSADRERQGSNRPVDPRDRDTIAQYENLASRLGGEVLIRYVAGGEQALARSVVCEMARYGLPHGTQDIGDIRLLADQTNVSAPSPFSQHRSFAALRAQWELFLRRAGLNTFAAQVILALLKDPADPSSSGNTTTIPPTRGLQTFLLMGDEARVRSFQGMLGGSRILTRVSKLLDGAWVSAAHGFRMQ